MHPLKQLVAMLLLLTVVPGCSILLPDVSTMPVVHNPFPQLSRVAVLPFFNLSNEPTVDGVQFAEAYFAELQSVPGFEVVPVGVVEQNLIDHQINTSDPADIRRLARLLNVDAVVVGAVTDFTPYYPPRCGMKVEWYAANPGYHEIPAGYGLPWGTPEEEYIPPNVVFEAELALAREQMKTQSPNYIPPFEPEMMPSVEAMPMPRADQSRDNRVRLEPATPFQGAPESLPPPALPVPKSDDYEDPSTGFDIEDNDPDDPIDEADPSAESAPSGDSMSNVPATAWRSRLQTTRKVPIEATPAADVIVTPGATAQPYENNFAAPLPPDWPDPRGFIPPGPSPVRPPLVKQNGPIMTHTRIFMGADPEFTTALAAYVDFRDDARFDGWRGYLGRSDDFIRFCCHLHINEMLSARGGASETRVVEHWSDRR